MKILTQLHKNRSHSEDPTDLPMMMAAESVKKQQPKKGGDGDGKDGSDGAQKLAKKGEQLKEEMDALVEEIDEVLEENAEEFVKNYVQRGGQ